ncbi:MAG: hypothetical protein AAF802_30315 [Planctomycetota bacterium]
MTSIHKCIAFLLLWLIPTSFGVLLFDSLFWHIRPDNCRSVFVGMAMMLLGSRLARHYSRFGPLFLFYGCVGALLFVPLYAPFASFNGDDNNGHWIAYIVLSVAFCLGCRYVAILDTSHNDRAATESRNDEPSDARASPS